jgi:mRNA interferase MazF
MVHYSDGSDSKPRPAIVITDTSYNTKFLDFIGVPMTTNLEARDHTVLITNRDFESGYLIKTSLAKVDKITSLEQSVIIRKIGVLNKTTYEKVEQEILKLLK